MSKLRELRERKLLTQKDLADLIGRTSVAISMWENYRGTPNIVSLQRLRQILGDESLEKSDFLQ